MVAYLVPRHQVGDFKLNEDISFYIEKFNLSQKPSEDNTGWTVYDFDTNISLFVEDGKIESISCTEECLYKGGNMIGMSFETFLSYYKIKPEGPPDILYVNDDEVQNVYEFDEIGLQIWCDENYIKTVIVSDFKDD